MHVMISSFDGLIFPLIMGWMTPLVSMPDEEMILSVLLEVITLVIVLLRMEAPLESIRYNCSTTTDDDDE